MHRVLANAVPPIEPLDCGAPVRVNKIACCVVVAVRCVVRHAAQQRVHGVDDAEHVNGVQYIERGETAMQRSLESVKIIPGYPDVGRIVFQVSMLQSKAKCDNSRDAACAHPSAEPTQVLPHAVTIHIFPAPPPQQQPVVQQKECRAEHGTKSANKNLKRE